MCVCVCVFCDVPQIYLQILFITPPTKTKGDPAKLRELATTPGQENGGGDDEDWRPPKGTRSRRRDPREEAVSGGGVVAKTLRRQLGFTLRVGPSTVPTAGNGVFLDGKARIGALVGLFPGLVYLPEHLKTPEEVQALFPDPDFFLFQRSVHSYIRWLGSLLGAWLVSHTDQST